MGSRGAVHSDMGLDSAERVVVVYIHFSQGWLQKPVLAR